MQRRRMIVMQTAQPTCRTGVREAARGGIEHRFGGR